MFLNLIVLLLIYYYYHYYYYYFWTLCTYDPEGDEKLRQEAQLLLGWPTVLPHSRVSRRSMQKLWRIDLAMLIHRDRGVRAPKNPLVGANICSLSATQADL